MQVYKITQSNRNAVCGRIKKFWESCAKKKQCYKFNGQIIFPFLTEEQIKYAQRFAPIQATCRFNGLRHGDIVKFYGGNKIVILGGHNQTIMARFIRIIPKNKTKAAAIINSLNRIDTILQSLDCINRNRRYYRGDSIHQPIVKPEFMFDQFIMSSAKKRYIVGPSLKDRLSQNIRDGISGDVQCIPENTTQ